MVQDIAIGKISHALAMADIIQHLLEIAPEFPFGDGARVSVEMPDPTFAQDPIE
jgi:hypothetical protein